MAGVVRLVAAIDVARALGLDAVVVGVRGVVPLEHIAAAGPARIGPEEHAVAAVRDVVVGEVVVVGTGLQHHAGRVAGVDLAGLDADSPTEVVLQHAVAASGPQAQAGVRGMGEVVLRQQVVIGIGQQAGIPDAVGLVLAERGMIDKLQDHAAMMAEFAPARLGIVEVVGKVAIFHEPMAAVFDFQPDVPALGVKVLQRHAGHAHGRDARVFVVLRVAPGGADDPRPAAVDGDVRGLDNDRAVDLRRIKYRILGDLQHRSHSRSCGILDRRTGVRN